MMSNRLKKKVKKNKDGEPRVGQLFLSVSATSKLLLMVIYETYKSKVNANMADVL